MPKKDSYKVKAISLHNRHIDWIKKNHINLSRLVQAVIDQEIKKKAKS
jgi:post-segregation antitoxin (ccd killing protein)